MTGSLSCKSGLPSFAKKPVWRGMSEAIKRILDAVTEKVLSYRPVDKGLAAKKTKRKLARKAKRDD
jgi:hypothetical protein